MQGNNGNQPSPVAQAAQNAQAAAAGINQVTEQSWDQLLTQVNNSNPTPNQAQQKLQNFNANSAVNPPKPRTKKTEPAPNPDESTVGKENPVVPGAEGVDKIKASTNSFFQKIGVGGGLAIAFGVLIALIWLLVPTESGYTRAQLLWFTMLGETKLTTQKNISSVGTQPDTSTSTGNQLPPVTPFDMTTQQQQPPIIPASGPDLTGIDFSALDAMGM